MFAAMPDANAILRGKTGAMPALVHTHPSDTVRDAIETAWFESRALRIVYEAAARRLTAWRTSRACRSSSTSATRSAI